ncbi:MAG: glycosidase [Marinilabiliaceae bacterium]|jgi:4-O-beta-D-mannosyl-D-glucose phosphorylase|nr:glycosidase [Marinilabiliaceae bacterium]
MKREEFDNKVRELFRDYEELIKRPNIAGLKGNGIYTRYRYPVLTREHVPPFWRYDLDYKRNPGLLTRLGVNTTFNAGAIKLNGKYLMIVRTEGFDVKSFFSVAESPNGIDNWRFRDRPVVMPVNDDPETNVYDMRVTRHEDGWIYGLFCAERKDHSKPGDSSAALASCGIARTRDLVDWERLSDLKSGAAQQRNCVLHPEFVNGKYMIYTRPQSGFIDTGDSGISAGFTTNMENAQLGEELLVDSRKYHTIKEVKNGQGPAPIKTEHGWIHLAHGVRRTAAGLRYALYIFLSDLKEPWKVTRRPGGHFIEPLGDERVGDVSNVVFSNGWIADDDGTVYIYYASSDTRMHVATTTIEKLIDYTLNTPEDPGRTELCAAQRDEMIVNNLEIIKRDYPNLLSY